jgi:serine-type D-Ala-D-Ala carboxypeptidase/endopeptidase
LLLADLAEHGIVGLDDPLAGYLPAAARALSFGGQQITLGDLASHAGGLRRDPKGTLRRWLRDRRNPYAELSVEELYDSLAQSRLRRRPGERVKYSNLGAGLLGDALARAAGQPYEILVRERICRPLGMVDTLASPSLEQAARLALGHTRRGRPVPRFQIPALAGAGALRSTATDMLRFLEANLDPASTPLAAQLERIQQPRHRMGRRMEVGLGWLIFRPPDQAGPVLWHNGGTGGFRSFVAVARETNTAVVVLSNIARSVDRLVGVGAWLAVALPSQVEVQAEDDPDGQPEQPQTVVGPHQEGTEQQQGEQHGRAHVGAQSGPVDAPKASSHRPRSSHQGPRRLWYAAKASAERGDPAASGGQRPTGQHGAGTEMAATTP